MLETTNGNWGNDLVNLNTLPHLKDETHQRKILIQAKNNTGDCILKLLLEVIHSLNGDTGDADMVQE
jgi:hypothetical protein